jgi:hypothetical protein
VFKPLLKTRSLVMNGRMPAEKSLRRATTAPMEKANATLTPRRSVADVKGFI